MELNCTEQTKKPLHFLIKIISRVGCFCNLFICDPHPVVSCPTGAAVRTDGWHFLLAWQCSGLVFILFNVNHRVFYVCINTKFTETAYHLKDDLFYKVKSQKRLRTIRRTCRDIKGTNTDITPTSLMVDQSTVYRVMVHNVVPATTLWSAAYAISV